MPNDEVLEFQCPKCSKRLKAGAAFAGRRVKCPKCSQPVIVPGSAEAPPQASTSTPMLSQLPVASLDDDWLNLGAPAIADISARQQVVDESKAARERKRTAEKNKQALRQASHRSLPELDDDLPSLAPETPSQVVSVTANKTAVDAAEPKAKRSVFDDDLPELSELQPVAPPQNRSDKVLAAHAGIDLSELEGLQGTTASPKRPSAPRNPAGNSQPLPSLYENDAPTKPPIPVEDKDPEYRIACNSCGTAQYVRLSSKGMKIKCPDCFIEFRVPPPPPGWSAKKKPKLQLTGEDIPLSAAEELSHAQTLEAQRSRASRILEKAEQQITDEDLDKLYEGDFDTAGFMQRTFGFLKDPVAVAHVVVFSIVFAVVFALGQFAANNLDSQMGRGALLLAAIGGPVVGLLFAMPMLSGGIALIESVANRQNRVTEWPGFNIFDNAGDIAAISLALLASIVPGFLVGSWLGGEGIGAGRIQIAGMMVTAFALFPLFLLSMLDNGSVFAPLSSAVFRSFSEAAEAWAAYFLKTFLAFSFVMLLWFLLLGKHEILAAIAGGMLPFLVFFTCQQIGALADGISEQLSFEFVTTDADKEAQKNADKTDNKQAADQVETAASLPKGRSK